MECKEATQIIIRDLMERYELSQDRLAEKLGVSQKVVSNWLRGVDMPKSSSLLAIYEAFGITPNEMLGIEERGLEWNGVKEKESEFLRAFRRLSDEEQEKAIILIKKP